MSRLPLLTGLFAAALLLLASASARADDDVKIGLLFDVTGPVASYVPPIADAVNLAVADVNAHGGVLGGRKLQVIVADTKGTVDGAIAAATKLVDEDKVVAIIGGLTSSSTMAAAHAVTIPKGVMMISPSATATRITTMEDHDFVFRVAPSDAYQAWMLAKLVYDQGFLKVALTYVNNDYGSGIEDVFRDNFENMGGTITTAMAHEPNKASYAQELTQLSAYEPDALVLIAFAPDSGVTIIKQAMDAGTFKQFIGTDALMDPVLIKEVGADKLKSNILFSAPTLDTTTPAAKKFEAMYSAAYQTTKGKIYISQAFDATMLAALAIEKAQSTDRTKIRDGLRQICCAPGEVVGPGDWAKATAALKAGQKINYEGASGNCDFDENGDVQGVVGHFVVEDGTFKQVGLVRP